MIFVIFVVLFGAIVGAIARSKGRSFAPWFIYGALIFIVAIVHVLLISPLSRKCPRCAEMVKLEALACRHCGNQFEQPVAVPSAA